MWRFCILTSVCVIAGSWTDSSRAQDWPTYVNETSQRLIAPASVGSNDTQAKNYIWGDVDKDGDTDLISVRKSPHMGTVRHRNVLFMNEGVAEGHAFDGVLVDRTSEYASAADDGGSGMLDLTSDRDVSLADVNDDGWLDVITATALSQGQPKTISHPRVYINLGDDPPGSGNWQGFRYEEGRTPQMPVTPNFCAAAMGDLDGDDIPDAYLVEYNNTLEDRLWINDGSGFFTDESLLRMTAEMLDSEFGVHAIITDLNGDGFNDVIKDRANGAPYRITVAYNDPLDEGMFSDFETIFGSGSPYYVEEADLNNDGLMDLVIQDDGTDRYFLNQGNGPDGLANFSNTLFPPQSNGFEGVIALADMNNDTFIDALICGETVNGVGGLCSREMLVWENDGDTPDIGFTEHDTGIPGSSLVGTWDVAPMDINGDGWLDMVIGSCSSTEVWMAQPPLGVEIVVAPAEDPRAPDVATPLTVQVTPVGGTLAADGVRLRTSIDGAPFGSVVMTPLGGGAYQADIPAAECLTEVGYYVDVEFETGETFTEPSSAPAQVFETLSAVHLLIFEEDVETTVSGWTVINDPGLTTGAWEPADPIGTLSGADIVAPFEPAEGTMAFVTDDCGFSNCPPGVADIDGGGTELISPTIELDGNDADIDYRVWFYGQGVPNSLTVWVTNEADAPSPQWVFVESIAETDNAWGMSGFRVGDYVVPTAEVAVRFRAEELTNGTLVEAGMDLFRVNELVCSACNPGCCDLDGDGIRDDGCVWCECDGSPCNAILQQIDIVFADMGGENGTCPPDGVADANDRFHALNCFSNQNTLGLPGYSCEPFPPSATNVDAGGEFGTCSPDGVCDGNDAFHALNAFQGLTSCSCPGGGPAPQAPFSNGLATLTARPDSDQIRSGELVRVDVHLTSGLDDLRGYQLHLAASGGTRGSLILEDITVTKRGDAVFGPTAWMAFNVDTAQMVAGLDGAGVNVSSKGYLASFYYRASSDAAGRFVVDILHDSTDSTQRTFLFPTAAHGRIDVLKSSPATVHVMGSRSRSLR